MRREGPSQSARRRRRIHPVHGSTVHRQSSLAELCCAAAHGALSLKRRPFPVSRCLVQWRRDPAEVAQALCRQRSRLESGHSPLQGGPGSPVRGHNSGQWAPSHPRIHDSHFLVRPHSCSATIRPWLSSAPKAKLSHQKPSRKRRTHPSFPPGPPLSRTSTLLCSVLCVDALFSAIVIHCALGVTTQDHDDLAYDIDDRLDDTARWPRCELFIAPVRLLDLVARDCSLHGVNCDIPPLAHRQPTAKSPPSSRKREGVTQREGLTD